MEISMIITGLILIGLYLLVDTFFRKLIIKHDNLTNRLLRKITRAIFIIVGIITVLDKYAILGEFTKTLLTNSALLVAVIGFLLQNTLKNILAGALLLSSETFKIGDRVRIPEKDLSGTIESINMRHTTLKLVTNERAIIPNSLLNDAIVVNNNLEDETTIYPLVVPIYLGKNITKAKQIIHQAIQNDENVLDKNIDLIVTTLKKDTVEIRTMIQTKDLHTSFVTVSNLRETIINQLEKLNYYTK